MFKDIKNAARLVLKNFSFLLILFVLFANNVLRAEEAEKKFIGFIDSLEGSVNKENVDDLVKLNTFDQIFTNDKIKIGPNSSIVVSFIDNSILTLQSDSEFLVEKFDKISEEPSFIIAITKGKFAFESGTIAKNDKGIMKIKLGEMEIDLKGTAITGGISDADDEITISLVEDTVKNTGIIIVTAGDETVTITEAHAGLKLSEDKSMEKTTMSEEAIIEAADAMSKAVVQASTIDPKKIERAIMKQLAEGKSGLTNLADVETLLANISSFQDDKRESIVAASTGDLSVLSEIIVNSDSEQSLSLMQGVMDNDTGNATLLMNEIMGGEGEKADFDIFSHIGGADTGNFEALRETIVAGMIESDSEFATETMAQMMKVSDDATGSYLVYEITHVEPTETTDVGASLAMNVLASFTANASKKMADLYQHDPSMIDMLTTSAFENATEQDIGMMSTMMQDSSDANMAMLMKSMVTNSPEMIGGVYNNLAEQNYDLFYHIETGRQETESYDPYMDPGFDPSPEDPYFDPGGATAADPFMDPGFDPSPMDPYYDPGMAFIDSLKGEIFSEIINHSKETSSVAATDMMMNAGGSSAMYMMENMMADNPELVTQVMDNFMYQEFDIFSHMTEPTYDPYMDPGFDPSPEDPYYDPGATAADPFMDPGFDPSPMDPYYDPIMDVVYDFQSDIIGTMMDHGGIGSMETMAYMMSAGDAANSAFILEAVMEHSYDPYMDPNFDPYAGDPYYDPYAGTAAGEENLALALLDEMAAADPNMMTELYDQQADLMGNMIDTAFSNASAEDASMIANVLSVSANEEMNTMMFDHFADMSADQSLMSEVFNDIAEQSPETLIAMATTDRTLYENMVYDPHGYGGGMSADGLMKDIMTSAGYDPGYSSYDPGYASYDPGYASYDPNYSSYDPGYASYDPGYASYDPGYASYDPGYASYDSDYSSYDSDYSSYDSDYSSYDSDYSSYDSNYSSYDSNYSSYDSNYSSYDPDPAKKKTRFTEAETTTTTTTTAAVTDTMPYWNYRFTDSMYQDSMYDGTNRVRGTFSASSVNPSPANTNRQIYTQLLFNPGNSGVTVAQVPGSELPAGLNIIKPAGYNHVEIYGTLPTVSELTTYNFELELTNATGSTQQEFTFYVDEGGVSRVAWRDPTAYSDNLSAKYFSYNEAVDITLKASTTNTAPTNNTVLFVSTPNPPLSWLTLAPVTIQSQKIIDGVYQYENVQNDVLDIDEDSATYNLMIPETQQSQEIIDGVYQYENVQNEVLDMEYGSETYGLMIPETQLDMEYGSETYEQLIPVYTSEPKMVTSPVYTSEPKMVTSTVLDQINITGTTPDDLAVYEDFTFGVKAYEKGADLNNLTTEQYNDREFIYQVAANPDCVSPAKPSCP